MFKIKNGELDDKNKVAISDSWLDKLLAHEVPRKFLIFRIIPAYLLNHDFYVLVINRKSSIRSALNKTAPIPAPNILKPK